MSLAAVSLYSHDLLESIWMTYHYVKSVMSVVGMAPHYPFPGALDRYFVIEKPGLDTTFLGGVAEDVPDEE